MKGTSVISSSSALALGGVRCLLARGWRASARMEGKRVSLSPRKYACLSPSYSAIPPKFERNPGVGGPKSGRLAYSGMAGCCSVRNASETCEDLAAASFLTPFPLTPAVRLLPSQRRVTDGVCKAGEADQASGMQQVRGPCN